MTGERKRTIEEWEKIGDKVKEVEEQVHALIYVLNSIPKTVWNKDFSRIDNGFTSLKSNLEDRMFKEGPNEDKEDKQRLLKVFYGQQRK
jgi:hypothetical protein